MDGISFPVEGTAMDAAFLRLTVENGLLHERSEAWSTAVSAMPRLGEVVASHTTRQTVTHVVRREDGALRVRLGDGWVHVLLASPTHAAASELAEIVRAQIPPRPPAGEAGRAAVSFWAGEMGGAEANSRELAVPAWEEIAGNYPSATRPALERLMRAALPLPGGRLVLWHGPPGTGKTNALRALAHEWRASASLHYVTDPEVLLARPSYMQFLLMHGNGSDRWRVIVLEDAGELLAPDAKERAGQGLARLLNLTDGLVGQGLKVLLLITGNEPLERLHPAVARPGRCAARVEFRPFDAGEAAAWLAARAAGPVDASARGGATLAELYARLEGRAPAQAGRRVGFGA